MRTLRYILLLLAATAAFFMLCAPVSAFTVTGGTEQQCDCVSEVIWSCALEPSATESLMGEVEIRLGSDLPDLGFSWWGSIYLSEGMDFPLLMDATAHEWCHLIYKTLPVDLRREWIDMVAPNGYDDSVWTDRPCEIWAESMRCFLFGAEPRDDMLIVDRDQCWWFLSELKADALRWV